MRRVFRRQIRKTLAQDVPPVLQEANFAFDKGEYGRAGELFEQIAQNADARGGPRAALFHLQAGRARILAGQVKLGMPWLRRGLELLAERGQLQKLDRAGPRVTSELKAHGLTSEAAEIESLLMKLAPALPGMESPSTKPEKAQLPTHCPSCGAALRPDEVEWLDDVTAECAYCGSPVRAEH